MYSVGPFEEPVDGFLRAVCMAAGAVEDEFSVAGLTCLSKYILL